MARCCWAATAHGPRIGNSRRSTTSTGLLIRCEAFFTQTQAFVDDVLDGRPDTVSGADGRAAVALVEAAWASSRSGQPVHLI